MKFGHFRHDPKNLPHGDSAPFGPLCTRLGPFRALPLITAELKSTELIFGRRELSISVEFAAFDVISGLTRDSPR